MRVVGVAVGLILLDLLVDLVGDWVFPFGFTRLWFGFDVFGVFEFLFAGLLVLYGVRSRRVWLRDGGLVSVLFALYFVLW